MCKRLLFLVPLISLAALSNRSLAFQLRVDIGETGQPVKAGWQEFSANHNVGTESRTYMVDGLSIGVELRTGHEADSGYRDYNDHGGGDLGADMLYPNDYDGPVDGRVVLTFSNVPAGDYILTSYHNDTKSTHAQQDPIDVTVSGAITASTSDLDVVQTKSTDDNNLGQSTVTFTGDGMGDVVITYTPTTDSGAVSKAVLNGFELMVSDTIVEFSAPTSSALETVSPATLEVILFNPPESNTVAVEYAVTGGTAEGNGVDYNLPAGTLTFTPGGATTKTIDINVIDDGADEEDESIQVTLSNPTNAALGAITQHTYTIIDPRPFVGFDAAAGSGKEIFSPVDVAVSLSWVFPETVTVDYNVTGGTAADGVDYNLPAGTLQFDPCDVTMYISFTIANDGLDEFPDETIVITLSNPGNSKFGANTQHTFTILPPPVRTCPEGDVDGTGSVDFNDLVPFVEHWLEPSGGCPDFNCADIDGTNGVDMYDLALLAGNLGETAWTIVINEFMASNDSNIADPQDEYDDWIELYNGCGVAV
ncbi:MAG: Calx-beta domain-containing protein, partial [Planctomycetota bacterium]